VPARLIAAREGRNLFGGKLDHRERLGEVAPPAVLARETANDLRGERDPVVGVHHDGGSAASVSSGDQERLEPFVGSAVAEVELFAVLLDAEAEPVIVDE